MSGTTKDFPGDIGIEIEGTFKWSKDMTRDELLRLVQFMRREAEWRRAAVLDAHALLDRANGLLEKHR